jgi:putative transposase
MVRSGREPAAVEVNVASNQQSNRTRQQRRRYTAEQRKAVVADALQIGVVAAAEQHGVPQSCVSRWSSEARQQAATPRREVEQKAPRATAGGGVPVEGRRVSRAYTPSQRALVVEYAAREGVTAASEKYGPSRYTIYEWQRKVAKAAAGQGDSPTGGAAESAVEAQRDREILAEWHRHPGLGPSQIKNQLRRRGVKVSVHTTRRVMEEAGYRPPKVKREPHDERYESIRPNHCWHLDFVHRHINRANTFTLILIDDYSRFVVGHGVEEAERADLVLTTFEEAVRRHGRPEMVMHDKGAAFWSWRGISRFTALLTELGIDQIAAEHKEWNGKVEVFNANLQKELFDAQRFYDVAEMQRRLAAHLTWYNEARTHHALGGLLVPADRYYGRADQVLARIEAGAGRDLNDGVELRDRCLELFKVTSRAGIPEVWLLGQKLLGAPLHPGGAMPGARPDSVG